MSMKFTPAAATSTTTSRGPGAGASRSTTCRTSGPPGSQTTTARMGRSCSIRPALATGGGGIHRPTAGAAGAGARRAGEVPVDAMRKDRDSQGRVDRTQADVARLTPVVRASLGRALTAVERLAGGSKKGVYRLILAGGGTAVLYLWSAEENYWPAPEEPGDVFADAS